MTEPSPPPGSAPNTPPVNALQRGLLVLRCFGAQRRLLSASDLMRMTGLPQPTVWRICKVLESEGFLVLDPSTKRYRPGVAVLKLGYSALAGSDMASLIKPYLEALAARIGGSAALAMPMGADMVFTQRCEASGAIVLLRLRVGESLELSNTANGWAYLAAIGAEARAQYLAALPAEDRAKFEALRPAFETALAEWSRTGYLVNTDIFLAGLTSIAVAFKAEADGQWFVVSCTAMTPALADPNLRESFGKELRSICAHFEGVREYSEVKRQVMPR